jgi:hypothetical protein
LLDLILAAHGGLDRWRSLATITATLTASGAAFDLKGHHMEDFGAVEATADVTTPRLTFTPWGKATQKPVGQLLKRAQ